jgi:Ankyrin repeats (3 copies)
MRLRIAISSLVLLSIFALFCFWTELQRVRRCNALHDAVFRGDTARVEELLDSGASVDQVSEDRVFGIRVRTWPEGYGGEGGVTPLYFAVWRNNLNLVKLLLSRGADVNHPTPGPYTILQLAVSEFYPCPVDFTGVPEEIKLEIVRVLVDAGADVNERWYPGMDTSIEMCQRPEMPLPHVKQVLEATAVRSSLETQTSN